MMKTVTVVPLVSNAADVPCDHLRQALTDYRSESLRTSRHWDRVGLRYRLLHNANPGATQFYTLSLSRGYVRFGLIYSTKGNLVVLHTLRSEPVGAGLGSIVMRHLCKLCDKLGVTIELRANPGRGSLMSRVSLQQWYESFGFKGMPTLVRQPKSPTDQRE